MCESIKAKFFLHILELDENSVQAFSFLGLKGLVVIDKLATGAECKGLVAVQQKKFFPELGAIHTGGIRGGEVDLLVDVRDKSV